MKIKLSQRADTFNPETGYVNQERNAPQYEQFQQKPQQPVQSQTPQNSRVIKRTKTPDGGWHIIAEALVGDIKKTFHLLFDKNNKLIKKWEAGVATAKVNYKKKIMTRMAQQLEMPIKGVGVTTPIVEEYYEIITNESAEQGDVSESGHESTHEFELDKYDLESGITIPDLVATFLKNEGANEFSSSVFDPNGWYTRYGEMDMHDGSYRNHSFHLKNMSEQQKKEVYEKVFGKK